MGGVRVFEKNLIYPPEKNSMGGVQKSKLGYVPPPILFGTLEYFILYLRIGNFRDLIIIII